MAIIKCVKCGKEISDTMQSCPHCGYEWKKENKKAELVYKGNLITEVLSSVLPAILVIVISAITEVMNKNMMGLYGADATDAYVIAQQCLPMISRTILLLVVFALCGAVSYFTMSKIGERSVVRIIIVAVGVLIYTIGLFAMTKTSITSLVGGREDLYSFVLSLSRRMGLFCGLAYGLTTAMAYLGAWYRKGNVSILLPLVEVGMFFVAMLLKNFLFGSVFGWGVNTVYSFGILPILAVMLIIPYVIFVYKKGVNTK